MSVKKAANLRLNIVFLCFGFFILIIFGCASGADRCVLPQPLQSKISEVYPGYQIITIDFLNPDDKKMFRDSHGEACPGLVELDFFGNKEPTYAMALLKRSKPLSKVCLVLATQRGEGSGWDLIPVDQLDSPVVPVTWGEAPGEYEDFYGASRIKAKHPVLIFAQYESWAILYAWNGEVIEKIWLSD